MVEFNGFEDFISSFHIYRGRAKSRDEEQDTIVGEFKVGEVLCFKLTIVFRLELQGVRGLFILIPPQGTEPGNTRYTGHDEKEGKGYEITYIHTNI